METTMICSWKDVKRGFVDIPTGYKSSMGIPSQISWKNLKNLQARKGNLNGRKNDSNQHHIGQQTHMPCVIFPILSKVLSIDKTGPNQEEVLTRWQQQSIQVQSGEMGQSRLPK